MEATESLKKRLLAEYGWKCAGSWSEAQLSVLLEAAERIETSVAIIKGAPARGWVKRYIRPVFRHTGSIGQCIKGLAGKSFVFPWRDVWMEDNFEKSAHPAQHVVHELAHVFDNHLGGLLPATFNGQGPADEMVRYCGGKPEKGRMRFRPMKNYADIVTPDEHWHEKAYGNVNVAEDFAETFAHTIFEPEKVPPRRLRWMQSFLRRLD